MMVMRTKKYVKEKHKNINDASNKEVHRDTLKSKKTKTPRQTQKTSNLIMVKIMRSLRWYIIPSQIG